MDSAQPMPTQYETAMQPPGLGAPGVPYEGVKTGMNTSVFKEPRGVMRILQFVFSICAFATTTGYTNKVNVEYSCNSTNTGKFELDISYPFRLDREGKTVPCDPPLDFYLLGNSSSDAQFFVAAGVLAFIYCILIIVVYVLFDAMYQSNDHLPRADFVATVVLAVLWLSGSAAWANGLSQIKMATNPSFLTSLCKQIACSVSVGGSFSSLDISIILGFLNFFLWASDLWFLYKETSWFKMKQSSPNMAATA
ncbi:synaptoporin-like isoform X3 [Schistocerca cancellata]|uniref:synaptoporin-like isoform X3 n=1 Tax=Schistocerca cancellata TaxID=274614 RepID=UPI002117D87D|nr:synaptoporin-like isoform X3 [Schistocerca cancellata]